MNTQKPTTIQKQNEWHFVLPDIGMIRRGRSYSVGVCVLETGGGLTAVGEVTSKDAVTGKKPDTMIFSTVSAAVKYLSELGGVSHGD